MQESIPINIVIGDRSYRVKIDAGDEEKVRKLIKLINERILEFKNRFAGKDMQDFIAMVLLWFVTEQQAAQEHPDIEALRSGLQELEAMIDREASS